MTSKIRKKSPNFFYNFSYFYFQYFQFSTFPFPIVLLFFSIFTPFPFFSQFNSKNFLVRSLGGGGHSAPCPPPVTPLVPTEMCLWLSIQPCLSKFCRGILEKTRILLVFLFLASVHLDFSYSDLDASEDWKTIVSHNASILLSFSYNA